MARGTPPVTTVGLSQVWSHTVAWLRLDFTRVQYRNQMLRSWSSSASPRGLVFAVARAGRGAPSAWWFFHLVSGRPLTELEHLLGIRCSKQVQAAGDQAGPARLVAGAQPGAIVAVEVFMKKDEVAPVRVLLKLPDTAVDRTPAVLVPQGVLAVHPPGEVEQELWKIFLSQSRSPSPFFTISRR